MVTSYVYGIRVRHRSILRPWQPTFQCIIASLLASEIKFCLLAAMEWMLMLSTNISPHLRPSGRPEHNSESYEHNLLIGNGLSAACNPAKCRTLQCGYTMYLYYVDIVPPSMMEVESKPLKRPEVVRQVAAGSRRGARRSMPRRLAGAEGPWHRRRNQPLHFSLSLPTYTQACPSSGRSAAANALRNISDDRDPRAHLNCTRPGDHPAVVSTRPHPDLTL